MIKKIKTFSDMIRYCLMLSWDASGFYTMIRLLNKVMRPLLNIASIYVVKLIIDQLTIGQSNLIVNHDLVLFLILSFSINILSEIIEKVDSYITKLHEEILEKTISERMMKKAMNTDMEFFDDPHYYDRISAIQRDMRSVTYVIWSTVSFVSSVITCIGSFFVLAKINVFIAVLMLICMIPSTLVNRKYSKSIYNLSLEQINDKRRLYYLNSLLTERTYVQDIRLYHIGEMIIQRYKNLWAKIFKQTKGVIRKQAITAGLLEFIPMLVKITFIVQIVIRICHNLASIGDYSLYTGMLVQFNAGLNGLAMSIVTICEHKLRIDNVKSLDLIQSKVINIGKKILTQFEALEFEHVFFKYPSLERYILEDVNFKVERNQHVALVGLNGTGKSTIIKLILRYYDVVKGSIKVNGEDIRNYDIDSLRSIFSTAFQTATTYGFSLRENISLGEIDSYDGQDKKVIEALKNCDGLDMYLKLEKGLDTSLTRLLDQDGVELSGGQYQKVTLARAFYRNSQFLLLDEPSAALDPEAEFKVFQKLNMLCNGKTALFTSHRLSNVKMADKIIVLEHGRVIEQGTQEELLALKKRYYTLYNYQAQQFNNENLTNSNMGK